GLPFGKSVDAVVEDDIGHVEIAAAAVDEVPGTDSIAITIASDCYHRQLMVRQLRASRDRQRPAVQRVQAVSINVVGRLPRTADAGNHRDPMRRNLQLKERLLDRAQDSEVAAARTPVDMDLGLVLLEAEFLGRGGGLRHGRPSPSSFAPTGPRELPRRSRSARMAGHRISGSGGRAQCRSVPGSARPAARSSSPRSARPAWRLAAALRSPGPGTAASNAPGGNSPRSRPARAPSCHPGWRPWWCPSRPGSGPRAAVRAA